MNRELPIYLPIKVVLLILIQAFVFSKMALFGFISPMIYLLILYIYPTHKNRSLWITWAFFSFIAAIIILHHLVYFSLEAFSWSKWLLVLEKTFSTGIVSFIFSLPLITLLSPRRK
jgi:hypothetical protein